MQENNNFEAIITTWRRLSGEHIETAVVSMSGDSSEYQPHKKKEEETDLLPKAPVATLATTGTATVAVGDEPGDSSGSNNPEEKKGFIQYDKEESKSIEAPKKFQLELQNKFSGLEPDCAVDECANTLIDEEAAGDANDKALKNVKNDEYLDNDKEKAKTSEKSEKDKLGDNVDSVYLRPPPPHKSRSNTSTGEQEDCGITCLYYTLQCCDCVLM